MNVLRFLVVVVILLVWFPFMGPGRAEAATSGNITVTASPYFAVPGGCVVLSIYYINDTAVSLQWTLGANTTQTMIRSAVGRSPVDRNDGHLVYYGPALGYNDTSISIAGPDNTYYSAFSQRGDGLWISCLTQVDTEEFMSLSFAILIVVILGIFLLWFSSRRPELLLKLCATLVWWGLGFWVINGDITNLGIDKSWTQMLIWVFFMAGCIPLVFQMNTEIKRESKQSGQSWTEWGERPEEHEETGRERYLRKRREKGLYTPKK
jgi:hypothetical protein